jgi:hypothetical protein
MPNWVHNTMTLTGPDEEVKAVIDKLNTTIRVKAMSFDSQHNCTWTWKEHENPVLSFHNIVTPDEANLDTYYALNEDSDNHWYQWNVNHWGTKWDVAGETEFDKDTNAYTFRTAWSPPSGVFAALAKQHPTITIHVHWIEEQGFGAEEVFTAGTYRLIKQWEIPATHEEEIEVWGNCWRCDDDSDEFKTEGCKALIAK